MSYLCMNGLMNLPTPQLLNIQRITLKDNHIISPQDSGIIMEARIVDSKGWRWWMIAVFGHNM